MIDRLLALDPGLVKTDGALRTLVAVPAGMAVGYALAAAFGLPAILGVMIGAMPAFITCLVIVDPSTGRTAARTGAVLVPFVVALAGSIALQPYRLLELVLIVVLLFLQFAAASWGAWASDAAIVGFAGYLCGLLLPLPETSAVPLGLVVAGSLAVTILVRLVLRPDPHRALLRTRRGFVARGSVVLEAAAAALAAGAAADDPAARRRTLRRLGRARDRYHEIALTVDGMLAASGVDADTAAEELHRLVFDTHFAIDELGRGAAALIEHGAPSDVRHAALRAFTVVLRHGGSHGRMPRTPCSRATASRRPRATRAPAPPRSCAGWPRSSPTSGRPGCGGASSATSCPAAVPACRSPHPSSWPAAVPPGRCRSWRTPSPRARGVAGTSPPRCAPPCTQPSRSRSWSPWRCCWTAAASTGASSG
ncbi:hypothetical protein P9139_14820 [Curtobacterium flaccumfaciens]|nr:hypothetical protein P9139_14820 [Curtobacterium flaccumfaciens]